MQAGRVLVFGGILTVMLAGTMGSWATEASSDEVAPQMEPVVVSAAKLPTLLSQSGSSVTVITAQDLENEKDFTVVEALRNVPGLDVVETGGPGQVAQVYMRGAGSDQTLVMVNGVEINDPISPNRAADLSRLTVDNVAQIEILRGPQSALFGSGGMGGVINIVTKKGSKNWEGAASLYDGKYNTRGTAVSAGDAAGTGGDAAVPGGDAAVPGGDAHRQVRLAGRRGVLVGLVRIIPGKTVVHADMKPARAARVHELAQDVPLSAPEVPEHGDVACGHRARVERNALGVLHREDKVGHARRLGRIRPLPAVEP